VCVCVCTLDLCVVLCLVLLVLDGQLHSVPRQIDFLFTWILEGKEEAVKKDGGEVVRFFVTGVSDASRRLGAALLFFSEEINASDNYI